MSQSQIVGARGAITSSTSTISGVDAAQTLGSRLSVQPNSTFSAGTIVCELVFGGYAPIDGSQMGGAPAAFLGMSLNSGDSFDNAVTVARSGIVVLSQAQWAAISADDSPGLGGTRAYFLSSSQPGKITSDAQEAIRAGLPQYLVGVSGPPPTNLSEDEYKATAMFLSFQIVVNGDLLTTAAIYGNQPGSLRAIAIRTPINDLEELATFQPEIMNAAADYPPGTPLYVSAENVATHAIATSFAASSIVCVAGAATVINETVDGVFSGPLHLNSTTLWDAVIAGGSGGGLIPGSVYYLSTTAGKITTTPPGSPDFVINVGTAQSANTLIVQIGCPVIGQPE